MTDKTQPQPEALRLAEQYDYGDPVAHSNTWKAAVCTELRRQHARIAELEAQLKAAGAASVLEDAARLERERICAAIKAEDDYCVDQGDYMLDSDDCIKIVRGEWVRPDFAIDTARKQGASHDKT